jgi:fructokinase
MKPVICFGEALIDFLNIAKHESDEHNSKSLVLNDYRQFPGGAPANAAVAVAKLGGKSYFSGQVGNDTFGDFIEQALQIYQVNTAFLYKHATAKTALAFVTLDETGERSFSFYRDQSADVLFTQQQALALWLSNDIVEQGSVFHFCSNTLTTTGIADTTLFYVQQAKQHKALVSFDVNLRHNLWDTGQADLSLVNELVNQADIVKFSFEELDYLSEGAHQSYINVCLTHQASLILVTNGGNDITYYTAFGSGTISPPKVNVVDTTAGGDGFVGGLLFGLSQHDFVELLHDEESLVQLLHFATACGAFAVSKQGAFPALPTQDELKAFIDTPLIFNTSEKQTVNQNTLNKYCTNLVS